MEKNATYLPIHSAKTDACPYPDTCLSCRPKKTVKFEGSFLHRFALALVFINVFLVGIGIAPALGLIGYAYLLFLLGTSYCIYKGFSKPVI